MRKTGPSTLQRRQCLILGAFLLLISAVEACVGGVDQIDPDWLSMPQDLVATLTIASVSNEIDRPRCGAHASPAACLAPIPAESLAYPLYGVFPGQTVMARNPSADLNTHLISGCRNTGKVDSAAVWLPIFYIVPNLVIPQCGRDPSGRLVAVLDKGDGYGPWSSCVTGDGKRCSSGLSLANGRRSIAAPNAFPSIRASSKDDCDATAIASLQPTVGKIILEGYHNEECNDKFRAVVTVTLTCAFKYTPAIMPTPVPPFSCPDIGCLNGGAWDELNCRCKCPPANGFHGDRCELVDDPPRPPVLNAIYIAGLCVFSLSIVIVAYAWIRQKLPSCPPQPQRASL